MTRSKCENRSRRTGAVCGEKSPNPLGHTVLTVRGKEVTLVGEQYAVIERRERLCCPLAGPLAGKERIVFGRTHECWGFELGQGIRVVRTRELRVEDGKIEEQRVYLDRQELAEQLGVEG